MRIVWQDRLGVIQDARAFFSPSVFHVKIIDLAGNLVLVGIIILAVQFGRLLIFVEGFLPVLYQLGILGLIHGVLEALFILCLLAGVDFHLLLALGRFDALISNIQHATDR